MIDIFEFDGKVKQIKTPNSKKKVWIDITDITAQERYLLQKEFNLHPLTAEDLFNPNIRIKVEEFDNYLFCVFYGACKTKRIELIEIDFIIGKNFLITSHKREIKNYTNLKKDEKHLEKLFSKGMDFLLHKLLDSEIDNFIPILEFLDDGIEQIEAKVSQKAESKYLSKILEIKRLLTKIRKATFNQREKASFLAKNEYQFISKKSVPFFRDIYDHCITVSDTVEGYREAIANTYDIYMSTLSNNMNEVMKTLSIIATIALPLSVISGIYGTNFTIIPGVTYIHGFWTMIILMVLMVMGMLMYFKKKHWF